MIFNPESIQSDDPGGTIEEALVVLSSMTTETVGSVSSSQLNKWAAAHSIRSSIMPVSTDYTAPAYELAAAARFALENTQEPLDLSDPEVVSMLDNLVTAGLISTTARSDLILRATRTAPKYPGIRYGDIERARAWS